MKDQRPKLVNLRGLALELNLPLSWLADEVRAGRLPHLRIGKRYRFNPAAVEAALAERAATGGKGGEEFPEIDGLPKGDANVE